MTTAATILPDEHESTDTTRPAWMGPIAGVASAAFALGVGEFVSGIFADAPSLVTAVGDVFVDQTPGSLVRVSIDLFGTDQKTMLRVGIVLGALALGSWLGAWALGRVRRAALGFGFFGLIGVLAAIRLPNASALGGSIAALCAALAGTLLMAMLSKRSAPNSDSSASTEPVVEDQPFTNDPDRRRFLGIAGAGLLTAAGGAAAGGALQRRSSVSGARAQISLPAASSSSSTSTTVATTTTSTPAVGVDAPARAKAVLDEVDGISKYLTPNETFYRIDTALRVPQVDPATWKMEITGLVDNPLEFTLDDLLGRDLIEEAVTISCVSNDVGGGLVGNAKWLGVPLADLLEEAGVRPDATQIVGESVDGWTGGFPTEVALDGRSAMVAVGMNDEPLPIIHGFPARLIVPGIYGYVSATKWLRRINLTRWEDFDGYWIPRGWSKLGPIKTQSRIDVPSSGQRVDAGMVAIGGVAWAPTKGIERVEVQIDDGPWVDAQLGAVLSDSTWTQWVHRWEAEPGRYTVQVRATDSTGETQIEERSRVDPDGATGWHRVQFTVV